MTSPVIIGDAALYLGDCQKILPTLGNVDAVVTDPPYGIGLEYGTFLDTPDNVKSLVASIIPNAINISKRCALTCATRQQHFYPPPDWVLCWLNRAGSYCNPWGFTCWQPILVYGTDPYLERGLGSRPDVIEHSETAEKNGHPCPKPIKFWQKLVNRISTQQGETILDPFMGSGTTGVACAKMGRKFIGIEIEPKYFDIACKRIEKAYAQPDMFIERPAPAKQEAFI